MCFVIARNSDTVNPDNAFLCGLLHEVGKLYILTKARDFPKLMGDPESLSTVLEQWYSSVGKSIVEAWGFSDEIANSLELEEHLINDKTAAASLVDVIYAAKTILEIGDDEELAESDQDIVGKLKVSAETLPALREAYDMHAQSMRQSVS